MPEFTPLARPRRVPCLPLRLPGPRGRGRQRLPHPWQPLAAFVLAVSLMAALGAVSVATLSTLRAYVGGESLWTKGEKQAVFHLVRYAQTRRPEEYLAWQRAIAVPLADRSARLELERPDADTVRVAALLERAGNHPQDLAGMITLFRQFGRSPLMAEAIDIWRLADQNILQLEAEGERLHVAVETDLAAGYLPDPWVDRIHAIDGRLTPLEDEFSASLGRSSRLAKFVLTGAFALLAALLVTLALAVARTMTRQSAALDSLRQESLRRLTVLAESDALTGLANRSRFLDRLAAELGECAQARLSLAVLFIDLDRFKQVNDTLGHAAGDVLLQTAAMRLRACVGKTDEVARLGGDEFALAMPRVTGRRQVAETADLIVEALGRPFELEGREVFVSASVGVAMFPGDGTDAGTLVRHADAAMYRTKAAGRNGVHFYIHGNGTGGDTRLQLEADLHHALERQQYRLLYQPRRELSSGRLCGFEALLRWHHPERGTVSPAEFIPVLEETGLIIDVGEWVIAEVCRQLRSWQDAGWSALPVAVNVSARQFRSGTLDAVLARALRQAGVPPSQLEVEITESMLVHDTEAAIGSLHRLKAAGVRLAVDDFGTGYSSLAYLKRFPIDVLKIDRAFVQEVAGNRADAAIVQAIIELAHGLGLRVTAEGLETAAQLDFVRRHGCDEGQGFLVAPPMDVRELAAWMAREHAGDSAVV